MAEKEKVPEHIKKFYSLSKKVKRIVDTHHLEHSHAYLKAAEILRDNEGNIDYEKLEDTKVQKQFVAKMTDHYLSKAQQALKAQKPSDQIERDMLLHAYAGITEGQLLRAVGKEGKDYTLRKHEGTRDQLVKQVAERLSESTTAHLTTEHLDDILKYTGADKHLKKELLEREHGIALLGMYEQFGTISPKIIEEQFGKKYLKKK